MYPVRQLALLLILISGALAGCTAAEAGPPLPPTNGPTATWRPDEPSTVSPPSPTRPAPLITAVPTAAATALASSTPRPPLLIAVPAPWHDAISEVAANTSDAADGWSVVSSEDPAALMRELKVDAAFVSGDDGLLVSQEHRVLAVPFTTNWNSVTEDEAQAILAHGHPLVTVMDWDDMRPTHRALRINGAMPGEAGYPLTTSWSIQLGQGREATSRGLVANLQERLKGPPVIRLAAVGDIMLDRGLGIVLSRGNLDYPFERVDELLQKADVAIGNLESSLGDAGEPVGKSYTFRAPPAAALSLRQAGFDILTLANNHALDYGPESLVTALSLLENADIDAIGAGRNLAEARAPHVREVGGIRLAFLGYVNVPVEVGGFDTAEWTATVDKPGLAWGEPGSIAADVRAAIPLADVVVVALHSGYEYVEAPSEDQVSAARAAIDAGAHLVIGHHAHILQGIEFYGNGVIVYGLGNFAFEITGPPETAILHVWLDQHGVRQLEIVPAVIQPGGQPRLAQEWEARAIREQVYRLTALLNQP